MAVLVWESPDDILCVTWWLLIYCVVWRMLQTRSKVHSIVPHLPGWHINLVQASRADYYTYTWMYLAQWIMTNTAPQQLVWLTCEWKTALPWSQVVAIDSIQYVYYLYCRMLLGAVIPPTKGSALLSGPHKTQLISCSSWHLSISIILLKKPSSSCSDPTT